MNEGYGALDDLDKATLGTLRGRLPVYYILCFRQCTFIHPWRAPKRSYPIGSRALAEQK